MSPKFVSSIAAFCFEFAFSNQMLVLFNNDVYSPEGRTIKAIKKRYTDYANVMNVLKIDVNVLTRPYSIQLLAGPFIPVNFINLLRVPSNHGRTIDLCRFIALRVGVVDLHYLCGLIKGCKSHWFYM